MGSRCPSSCSSGRDAELLLADTLAAAMQATGFDVRVPGRVWINGVATLPVEKGWSGVLWVWRAGDPRGDEIAAAVATLGLGSRLARPAELRLEAWGAEEIVGASAVSAGPREIDDEEWEEIAGNYPPDLAPRVRSPGAVTACERAQGEASSPSRSRERRGGRSAR